MTQSLLFVLLSGACGEDPTVPTPVALRAPDASGVFVWVADGPALAEAVAVAGKPARLQWRPSGGAWSTAVGPVGEGLAAGQRYWLGADTFGGASVETLELRLAVGAASSSVAGPDRAALDLELVAAEQPLVAADLARVRLDQNLGPLASGSGALEVKLTLEDGDGSRTTWFADGCADGASLADCVSDLPTVRPLDDLSVELDLPSLHFVHDHPASITVDARLWLDAIDVDGAPVQGLIARGDLPTPLLSTGRTIYWGDLHAHSNLSHDGCEVPDDGCDHRGDYAGQDFFQYARDNDLDFVALTDHAEWERYYPDGLSGSWVDIWSEQKRLINESDALGDGMVALIGYEWTNKRDKPSSAEADAYYAQPYEGGHKTVVFQEVDVPVEFRIGSTEDVDSTTKGGISAYTVGDNPQTDDPRDLFALLDDAAAMHGATGVVTFFHHSAIEKPQGADFGNPISIPDSRYERLIEIYSEHGSSECVDRTTDDCGWEVNDENFRYLTRGTVQYALSQGWRLGFVAGTDCHDARPGSWEDGPNYHGNPGAAAGSPLNMQFAPGGLTGAIVVGDLDRDRLFDALYQRSTMATSGPRVEPRVLAIDALGRPWLPGQVVPPDASPLRVVARIAADGFVTDRVSLVAADGDIVYTSESASFDHSFELEPDGAWYLRAVLRDPAGGEWSEHRIWVSPFFTESE